MAAYRPLGPFPQYFLADGTVNNGGLINFYETDLTTPKDTFSDDGLSTPNSNPVVLDSAGRPETDIWGDGAYGVVITDSLGANPRTLNNVQPDTGAGSTIPTLVTGDFLTNNGSVLLWEAITQVPDPTGFPSGSLLNTDGTLVYWAAAAASPAEGSAGLITVGSQMFQWGTDTAPQPSSGVHFTSKTFTYPVAFTGTPRVFAVPKTFGVTSAGGSVTTTVQSATTTSAQAVFDDNDFGNIAGGLNTTIAFDWLAVGPK